MAPLGKIVFLICGLSLALSPFNAWADAIPLTRENLQKQIEDRAKQLDVLNQAIQTTQTSLKDVQNQKNTLQNQVKTLDYSIKQLNLNIQADEVSTQKISGEIQSLSYDLRDVELSIDDKSKSVADLFRELQRNEGKNTLIVFLENKTLAEGLTATESIEKLRSQLAVDIESLGELHAVYQGKLNKLSDKKSELQFHQNNLRNRKQITEDTKQERAALLAQTKDKESAYQKQLSDLKKLQEDIANEIESMDAQLRSKVDPKFLPPISSGVLGMPIQGSKSDVTQGYGATTFAKYGYRGRWHNGVDFGVPIGTPIFASEAGIVLATGNQDKFCYKGAYGKFILIKHNNNLTTLYGHLSKYIVSSGQAVSRGQVIGYSGKSGYATGPHLHFTVFATPTIPPVSDNYPEGISPSRTCGPMPYGGDLNPLGYL